MRRSLFARLALGGAASLVSALPARAQIDPQPTATPTPELRRLGEDVSVTIAGGAQLYGSLAMPSNAKPPVVLIVPGSGPIDRNGNTIADGLSTDVYAYLAAGLQSRGIASLRYDKRGIGESSRAVDSESKIRFDDYIADAVAWLTSLRGNAKLGPLSIAGHSEGSLIAMLAAAEIPVATFTSLEGAGRPLAEILRSQLDQSLGVPSLVTASQRILAALERGETTNAVPRELLPLFRPSVQPYLISAFKFDPRQAIQKAGRHAAIVQGTLDLQVPVADAQLLLAARPDAKLTLVDNMTQVLKIARTNASAEAQYATVYADASIPISPQVPDAIAAILRA